MRIILGRIALPSEPGPPQNGVQEPGAGGEQCQEFCWNSKMLTTCSWLFSLEALPFGGRSRLS